MTLLAAFQVLLQGAWGDCLGLEWRGTSCQTTPGRDLQHAESEAENEISCQQWDA